MEIGSQFLQDLIVEEQHTAKAMGSGTLAVFASPAMIALMENTCMQCVAPYLEEGQATVGTLLNVKHVAASPLGASIRCSCELIEVDRKRLVFSVQAFDNAGLIGEGVHERYIIQADRFMQKALEKLN